MAMNGEQIYDKLNSFYLKLWWNLAQFFPEERALDVNPGVEGTEWPELAPSARQLSAFREMSDLRNVLKRQKLSPDRKQRALSMYTDQAKKAITLIEAERNRILKEAQSSKWKPELANQVEKDADQTIDKINRFGGLASDITAWQDETRRLKDELAQKASEYAEHIYSDEGLWKDQPV